MALRNLHYLELCDLAGRLRAGDVSPVALTQAMLKRIARTQPRLRAYARVTEELALTQAKRAEAEIAKGRYRGPLHGVPITVKDLCYTKGIVTAAGMPLNAAFKPRFDATVVRRLRDAGAVLLGKLQMTEGAFSDHHPDIPAPINPWHKDYWTGVSSSGSGVATATGLCFTSLGSDTGGSIRLPSSANGLTGLKPTWGRVSRYGVFDLAPSLDHVGPMCRSAADCAAVLGAIAGADANDPTASPEPVPNYLAGIDRPVRGLRIGIDRRANSAGVDADTRGTLKAAEQVFKDLGADLRAVQLPDVSAVAREWVDHCAIETAAVHSATYPKHKDRYGPVLAALIERGLRQSGVDFHRLMETRRRYNGELATLFETVDLLLVPVQVFTTPTVAERKRAAADPKQRPIGQRFTAPFDYSGSPALTLPGGFTDKGLPVAFQLISRPFEEDIALRAGHAFQKATDWHRRHPTL